VSATALRVYRLLLVLYPAEFRRRYGDEMIQLLIDRHRHEQRPTALALLHETVDAVRTAPRMRWESPMNRTVIITIAATVAIAAALVANVLLLPLGLAAIAAWFAWGRPARPIAPAGPTGHWVGWLAGGVVAIAGAVMIPAVDGGELSGFWWTMAALALLSGIAMTITALVLATSQRPHGLASPRH
jgi:hypothetical protein